MNLALELRPVVRQMLCVSFWAALFLAVCGNVMSFVPGAECGWFLVVAALALPGLLIRKRPYRIAAFALVVFAIVAAYGGYQHGVAYRQGLAARHAAAP